MPHGDFSDVTALFCAMCGGASMFAPELWFKEYGSLKPMFDGPSSPEALALIRFAGGLLMFMAPVLYVVRWNTLNGKACALGLLIIAGNTAHVSWKSLKPWSFVSSWPATPSVDQRSGPSLVRLQ